MSSPAGLVDREEERRRGFDARLERWTRSKSTPAASATPTACVNAHEFYGEYHGHRVEHLEAVLKALRGASDRPVIWMCGDSTLDNKYWLPGIASKSAVNGYESALTPAVMQADVCYWLNSELQSRGLSPCAVNCAVEESTLGVRKSKGLMPQDQFIADNLRSTDVLLVSCGGNDIALRPSVTTILAIVALMATPLALLRGGWAPGLSHLVRLFRNDTRALVEKLVAEARSRGDAPRCVVCCMLYFLDEAHVPSWANTTLRALGYDRDPTKLQMLIRRVYEEATMGIHIDGIPVVPLPFFEALDGKDTADYVQRVEPSSAGGRKMACAVIDRIASLWK